MELDHLFFIADQRADYPGRLRTMGLVESYRRDHPGQGTANVCYCFDNMYLEILWVTDEDAIQSPAISRTGLRERAQWKSTRNNPFGLAWREKPGEAAFDQPCWDFKPPYLPEGMTLAVSTDSDDPRQPFMFRSPNRAAPIVWPSELRGTLQHDAGLGAVSDILLFMPRDLPVSSGLRRLGESTILRLEVSDEETAAVTLTADRKDGGGNLKINLPVMA